MLLQAYQDFYLFIQELSFKLGETGELLQKLQIKMRMLNLLVPTELLHNFSFFKQ
jgi:hypothetical protein